MSNGGLSIKDIWERVEVLTDKIVDQSSSTTQILGKFHNTLHNMEADMEALRAKQAECLARHNDKKTLCVLADPNDSLTQNCNKLFNNVDGLVVRTNTALSEVSKTHKWLYILIAFLIASVLALVGVKIAIPGF